MTDSLSDLLAAAGAVADPWRIASPFSEDLAEASQAIWDAGNDAAAATALSRWLVRHQPCLFGRVAAKNQMLGYCFITEADVAKGEQFVFEKVQSQRLAWQRKAYAGEQHGFILLLASRNIACALPGEILQQLSLRLASLYLEEEVQPDTVHLEHLFLAMPTGTQPAIYMWPAGVNVFCAQGDGRWWNDHRIPGGIGFSVNSVGHMVKSAKWRTEFTKYVRELALDEESSQAHKLDSLERALELAMRTIDNASIAVSGKATWLEPRDHQDGMIVPGLDNKSPSHYSGYYHTDHTVPSCYFVPDVARPERIAPMTLDFTYLHKAEVGNVDSYRIGAGRRITTPLPSLGHRLAGAPADRSHPLLKRILPRD